MITQRRRAHPAYGGNRSGLCPDGVRSPAAGAGTTGLVAERLERDTVLIELNPTYAGMARDRAHRHSKSPKGRGF